MAGCSSAVSARGAAPTPGTEEEHAAAGCVAHAQPLASAGGEERDRRARERSEHLGEGIRFGQTISWAELAVTVDFELWRDWCRRARDVDVFERPRRGRRPIRRSGKQASDGIAESADLVQVANGEGAIPQACLFCLKPSMKVRGRGKEVQGLALAEHHHRVGEVDRERLTKPPKHGAATPCWPEPLDLTAHLDPAILTAKHFANR
jgi:hypothetical protein